MTDYAVVWPRSPRTAEPVALAARPATLDGRRIAFLWDYMFRGEEIFPIIERELRNRIPGVSFVSYDEFGTTHGAGEHEVLERLGSRLAELGVDAVVSGMGC